MDEELDVKTALRFALSFFILLFVFIYVLRTNQNSELLLNTILYILSFISGVLLPSRYIVSRYLE